MPTEDVIRKKVSDYRRIKKSSLGAHRQISANERNLASREGIIGQQSKIFENPLESPRREKIRIKKR